MEDSLEPMGAEKALCINPKCRKTFKIPANHQGRKPVLCPDCKEAEVKVKDLGLPEQKKAARKPRKTPLAPGLPPRPAPAPEVKAQGSVSTLGLVCKIRSFRTEAEAEAYYRGYLDGVKAGM